MKAHEKLVVVRIARREVAALRDVRRPLLRRQEAAADGARERKRERRSSEPSRRRAHGHSRLVPHSSSWPWVVCTKSDSARGERANTAPWPAFAPFGET